jgi:hypothetical protein
VERLVLAGFDHHAAAGRRPALPQPEVLESFSMTTGSSITATSRVARAPAT